MTAGQSYKYFSSTETKYAQNLLKISLGFLLLSTLMRLGFYLSFATNVPRLWSDLSAAFLLGFRFDLSVLCYILLLPNLILLLTALIKKNQWIESTMGQKIYFNYLWLMFFTSTCLMAIDFGFYNYFQDRINILIFGFFEDDTNALVHTIWKNYPVLTILFFTGLFGIALQRALKKGFFQGFSVARQRRSYVVLLTLLTLGARGSFGLFPLSEIDTEISHDTFINRLGYNSVVAFQRATKHYFKQNHQWNLNLKAFGYGDDYLKALSDYRGRLLTEEERRNPVASLWRKSPTNEWSAKNHPHVVLFVIEGLGAYWLPRHSSQFDLQGHFARHATEDALFLNFLPATGSTIGSISGLMVGMPHRPEGPFLTESGLLQVEFPSAPARVFAQQGYHTEFVYGGSTGWRDIDRFAHFQGFAQITGQIEIQAALRHPLETHDWGVFDEDVFTYVQNKLKAATVPQFILVLTTTNHPPFELPAKYQKPQQQLPVDIQGRMVGDAKLNAARLQTYRYSLDQLGVFMDQLKQGPLREKTIVAATGDHSFYILDFKEEELFKKWSVPFYLYTPPALAHKFDLQQLGAHQDIPPTLYALALSEAQYLSFGSSFLDPQRENQAFHFSRLAVNQDGGVLILNSNKTSYLNWTPLDQNPFDKLTAGQESVSKTKLATQYKAVMGLVDYYFYESKKKGHSK